LHDSSKCKHVYSKDVLVDYIKQNTENRHSPSVKCPTAGCSKIIELSDLTEDKQLERRIQQHLRREEERGAQQRGTYQAIDEDDDEDEEEE
jgi:SUMO ligase MMS21 Smc5/6 complex component